MNYYKRHIGDYAKKAGHLSVLEHGVYTLLLDSYYDREQAPTRAEALRQARARTPEEVAAVDAVLSDFFVLDGDRYTQSRVEEEFVKAEEQAKKNEENGKKGGRPRKPKGNRKETQPVSVANPSESEKNPNPLIHQSTNPLTGESKATVPATQAQDAEGLFPKAWAWYPKRAGSNSRADALAQWLARSKAGEHPEAMLEGTLRYAAFISHTGKGGTEFVMQAARFYGKAMHYREDWALPLAARAPPSAPSKTLALIQKLEGMKNGLADPRSDDRIAETAVPRLGSDSGNRFVRGDGDGLG